MTIAVETMVTRSADPRRLRDEDEHSPASRVSCRVLGHRYRFRADGSRLVWACERGCGAGGHKTYRTAAAAARYAAAFDKEDRADFRRRSPLVALLTLRLWQRFRGDT